MAFPKVSIVIPSFNQGHFIERTLLSILKQDYDGEVEIIVSDGGSNDSTIAILQKYSQQIIWWSEKDRGYADAVNKGFAAASGEIFGIQSSDDYYLKDAFKKLISVLKSEKELSLVCGREALQEQDGIIFGGYELPQTITPNSFIMDHPFPGIFQHTTFFRKEYYYKVGGMRQEFDICADADLFYRLLHLANGRFLNDYIAVYQKHGNQRTANQTIKFRDKLIEMVLSCRNDRFYSENFILSDNEMKVFKDFIELFYMQFENLPSAISKARLMQNNRQDKRTAILIDGILSKTNSPNSVNDSYIDRIIRSAKRHLRKYIRYETGNSTSFSDEINSGWWSEN